MPFASARVMTTIYQCVESERAYVGYKLRSMSPGNTVSSWLWLCNDGNLSQSHDETVLPGTLLCDL